MPSWAVEDMNQLADVPVGLTTRSKLPAERIVYYSHADESLIGEIRCGVLFVMAYWSIYAVNAFVATTELLAELDPDGRLQFVVVDTDGTPALYDHRKFLGRMSGAGETAWIRDGQIVRQALCFDRERFIANTRGLLDLQ